MNIRYNLYRNDLKIVISGDWIHAYEYDVDSGVSEFGTRKINSIIIDGTELKNWDTSLLVLVSNISRWAQKYKKTIKCVGFPPGAQKVIDLILQPASHIVSIPVHESFLSRVGARGIWLYIAFMRGLVFVRDVCMSFGRWIRGRAQTRRIDWWYSFDAVGPRAVFIVSLISFLIGLILAFVGAAQLKLFGAQVYVASLVAIAAIRIMGAMMTGIIMAGRTGAAYAATIGTMQANEELDALQTMGINKIDFLVLPRVVAMAICMPILTLLADFMAILGGAFVGCGMFHIPLPEYISYTVQALDVQNFSVGIFHGLVYGIIIALCGCYYGINCGRDAGAVGVATTRAVVSSVVWMIVATGIITFLFEVIGI